MPLRTVLLFEDETILRLFPSLRRAWARQGQQGIIAVSGHNDQRVLFGSVDVHSGHRVVLEKPRVSQSGFQEFLQMLRTTYRRCNIWLLLDGSSVHKAAASRALAQKLKIELIFLPRQCPELNAMDHLWRHLKADTCANYQYKNMEELARAAESYVRSLSNQEAKTKAGINSKHFWLKSILK